MPCVPITPPRGFSWQTDLNGSRPPTEGSFFRLVAALSSISAGLEPLGQARSLFEPHACSQSAPARNDLRCGALLVGAGVAHAPPLVGVELHRSSLVDELDA
jgi:hypothetical protein